MSPLSQSEIVAASVAAQKIGVPLEWLLSVINFETAGTNSPTIKNPNSTARGLIQFIDASAQKLGYRDSLDLTQKNPTFEEQVLGPVLNYFLPMRPYPTKQSFYMAVFAPAYRFTSSDTLFPDKIRAVNPGIDTVQSYVDKVDKKKSSSNKLGKVRDWLLSLPLSFSFLSKKGDAK